MIYVNASLSDALPYDPSNVFFIKCHKDRGLSNNLYGAQQGTCTRLHKTICLFVVKNPEKRPGKKRNTAFDLYTVRLNEKIPCSHSACTDKGF